MRTARARQRNAANASMRSGHLLDPRKREASTCRRTVPFRKRPSRRWPLEANVLYNAHQPHLLAIPGLGSVMLPVEVWQHHTIAAAKMRLEHHC
ncbi:MAG TPA: hypothetical protein VFU69_10345 [Ktedonobacterales bacterium]|nr:hypothetical protein [Ktedonobacterales bacterium]